MSEAKTEKTFIVVMVASAIVNGLLSGGNVDRALVAMPAWSHAGLVSWAGFSRSADLGNGLIVYPAMAIGGTLLTLIAAALALRNGRMGRAALPAILAAALMLAALPVSLKATPFMLSLRRIPDTDTTGLAQAFAGFAFWGRFQGILHVGAFCATLWALAQNSWRRASR